MQMFKLQCTNKGCYETTDAQLDLETNNVYCTSCDKPIENITAITKNQLKFSGQIKKPNKKAEGFSVKCDHCHNQGQPIVKDDLFFCKHCNAEMLNISHAFQLLLRNKTV
jgi:hypothetical protein